MTGDSVDQCRVGDAQPIGGAERPCLRLTTEDEALLPDDPGGGFRCARNGKADMIQQTPGALVQHVGGDVGSGGVTYKVEQRARLDGGPIVVVSLAWCHVVCITEFLSVLQTGVPGER